ncbi:MAG: EAL domain-containing protein [Rhodospirillaceae bacterium]|nr:EAL domain-containing protein [Rhodospirillaceae bacterium]
MFRSFQSFQAKLILFFGMLFVVVGAVTFLLVQNAIQRNIFDQARAELSATNEIFNRRLADTADALAGGSALMASDFGFRQAVATDDRATILSALHNLESRIKADRVLLVSLDATVLADTASPSGAAPDKPFRFTDMIETAEEKGRATANTIMDEKIYELVVVPVLAPLPIAWIVVGIESGDTFVTDLQRATTVPVEITFAFKTEDGAWKAPASTLRPHLKSLLLPALGDLRDVEDASLVIRMDGSDYVSLVVPLASPRHTPPVYVVLQYSLDVALQPYRPLFLLLIGLAGAALVVSLMGAVFIARTITKPIRVLDAAARRIQAGRYTEKVAIGQQDEIGRLSETFNQMMSGIAEREDRIAHQARHDPLSGLPNRMSFEGHVADMIIARQENRQVFSVILLQIGRFSELINTLGHDTGDQLIRKIGKNLRQIVSQPNAIARHASNIFAIALDTDDAVAVSLVVERILSMFDKAVSVAGFNIDVTATIGEARYPEHGGTARTLMQHADTAIYEAKQLGRSYASYDPQLDPHRPERLSMMGELRRGLDLGQFTFFFQPKVDLATETVTTVEALIRWNHPERGFMVPDSFIPLAEQTGNIGKLTAWALAAAIKQSRAWADKGINVKIAVNLSPHDLGNKHLPSEIENLLAAYDVSPGRIILEITESAVMEDPAHAQEVLKTLSGMGLTLSVDDYGIGHSSLAYLKSLPVQEIKIDKSFVLKLADSRGDQILVKSTIELGHNLGLRVTAEGIEDRASLEILQNLGCDTGQGYFISRPITAEDFETFFKTSRWSPHFGGHGIAGVIAATGG